MRHPQKEIAICGQSLFHDSTLSIRTLCSGVCQTLHDLATRVGVLSAAVLPLLRVIVSRFSVVFVY